MEMGFTESFGKLIFYFFGNFGITWEILDGFFVDFGHQLFANIWDFGAYGFVEVVFFDFVDVQGEEA